MHIGIAGPIATADIRHLLDDPSAQLPRGYEGAPLLATLIAELLKLGHRVSAFTLSSDMPLRRDATRCARGSRFELHYVPMRPRAWPFNGWRTGRIVDLYAFERGGLERAMRSAQPDVVHAHWAYEFAWAALRSGLPHVVTCHDSPFVIARFYKGFKLGGYRWLRAFMAWHVLRKAHRVTTVSPYMVEQIQTLCAVPVQVVPNPISTEVQAPQRPTTARLPRVLVSSNGWDMRKNSKVAMTAFSEWAAGRSEAELHLYGQGFEEGGPACSWWKQQGLRGTAHFHGPTLHSKFLAGMAACDVLLHGSLEESFGMVVAEAMASGLVVIAGQNSGAVPWVVGSDGLLVDVRDTAAIAQALATLERDPKQLRSFGERGRRAALSRFGSDTVVSAYLRQYEAAILCGSPETRRLLA